MRLLGGRRGRVSWWDVTGLTVSLAAFAVPRISGPHPGLDAGWINGLAMAASSRMQWGRDIVFTYGPWGFLEVPLATSRLQVAEGLAFDLVAYGVLFVVLRLCLAGGLGRRVAAVAACIEVGLVAGSTGIGASTVLLAAAAGLLALELVGDAPVAGRPWVAPVAGAVAGLTLNIKFIEGVVLASMALLVAFAAPGKTVRDGLRTVAAVVGVFLLTWVAAGQVLTDLVPYVTTSVEMARGYSDAMSSEGAMPFASYIPALALCCVALAASYRSPRGPGGWRQLAPVALVLLALTFAAKSGFTRHDQHDQQFFLIAGVVLSALYAARSSRLILATLGCAAFVLSGPTFHGFDLRLAGEAWASNAELLAGSGQATMLTDARAEAQAAYGLPANVVARAQGHPTHVDPWEITAAWAYGLRWRPTPVFQQYAAYTATLDQLDATALKDAPSDQTVLRSSAVAIDGRNPIWESPRYTLALMCDYRPAALSPHWMLLSKTTDHCSAEDGLGTFRVVRNRPVTVPTAGPNEMVVAHFVADRPSLAEQLVVLVAKEFRPLRVTVAPNQTYRLPRNLADGPLMVHVPTQLGWPAQFGGRIDYRSLTFNEDGSVLFQVIRLRQ